MMKTTTYVILFLSLIFSHLSFSEEIAERLEPSTLFSSQIDLETTTNFEKSTDCEPDPISVSIGGTVINGGFYLMQCGETCIDVQATNLLLGSYNTSSPVFNNLNGLFCVPGNSSLNNFVINITGVDTCDHPYSRNIRVIIPQDCACCDAGRNLLSNGEFDNATCAGNSAFNRDCVPGWSSTSGSPSLANSTTNPNAWMWSYGGNGEGITSTVNFIEGTEYSICFIVRADDKNSGDPNVANNATINLVATNSPGSVTANPTGDVIFSQTMGSYLNGWRRVTATFTATDDFSQLWIYPFMADPSDGISQAEMAIDNIIVSACCRDTNEIGIFIDGVNLGNETSYTIPCGQECIDVSTGNLLDVTYNTNNPLVQNNQDGTFCIGDTSPISFTVTVSGLTTCGQNYSRNIVINTEDDCPPCVTTAPTNLNATGSVLTWDPVPGASSYMIIFPNIDDLDIDCCENQIEIDPIDTISNYFDIIDTYLGDEILEDCFVWQVVAVCDDGTLSPPSDPMCFMYDGEGESESLISIYPNPNRGNMNIKIESEISENVTLRIHKIDGTLVRTINNDIINGMFIENWNSTEFLEQGLYFFSFEIGNEKVVERVIIE